MNNMLGFQKLQRADRKGPREYPMARYTEYVPSFQTFNVTSPDP